MYSQFFVVQENNIHILIISFLPFLGLRQSPTFKRRANVSPPVYNRGGGYSPMHKRKRLSPLSKQIRSDKAKLKRAHSSSSSDSGNQL